MSGYANLIFDFDGTLVDSKDDIAGAQLWVLHQLGVDQYRREDLYRYIGKPLQQTFSAILPTHLHHRIPEAATMYAEYYPPRSIDSTRLFPGVLETLENLFARGHRMAIASTKRIVGLQRVTAHFNIEKFFVQLQGSDEVPFKPDPYIINKIIGDRQWERVDTVMVGDTDNDILAGRNAGIATCGVTYGSLPEEALKKFSPTHIIHRFEQILSLRNHGSGARKSDDEPS